MRSVWFLPFLPLVVAAPAGLSPAAFSAAGFSSGLCQMPYLKHFLPVKELCRRSSGSIQVQNPQGKAMSDGVLRFSGKYATAARWEAPVISSQWTPAVASDPTALPKACPQDGFDAATMSEDCLDIVIYVPPSANTTDGGVPTIFWIHGGSFKSGSASDPSLDGSNLAVATNTIVAVVQYRLGVLGLLPPAASSSNSNLALQDVMTALTFMHGVLPSFGGSGKITLAGQSSGASIIRALLGTPSAQPLFDNAWLHSDPVDYGFLTQNALSQLRGAWVAELGCASASGCAQNTDLATLMGHQSELCQEAPNMSAEFYFAEPLRPSPDGVFMTSTFTTSSSFPSSLKPIVITTVKDEAAPTIYTFFSSQPTEDLYILFITGNLGEDRASKVTNSSFYPLTPDPRDVMTLEGTDEVWRCPSWKLARDWASHGSTNQYAAVITQGLVHPDNAGIPQCSAPGVVCHEDDIRVLFGVGSSPLTAELQARYSAFIRTNNPNAEGLAQWNPATSSGVQAHNLGGPTAIAVGACVPSFWGDEVPFDYQVDHE